MRVKWNNSHKAFNTAAHNGPFGGGGVCVNTRPIPRLWTAPLGWRYACSWPPLWAPDSSGRHLLANDPWTCQTSLLLSAKRKPYSPPPTCNCPAPAATPPSFPIPVNSALVHPSVPSSLGSHPESSLFPSHPSSNLSASPHSSTSKVSPGRPPRSKPQKLHPLPTPHLPHVMTVALTACKERRGWKARALTQTPVGLSFPGRASVLSRFLEKVRLRAFACAMPQPGRLCPPTLLTASCFSPSRA